MLALVVGEESTLYKAFDASVPEPVAALVGAVLLVPAARRSGERAINWDEAARIDWGIILLFGGGLSLGMLVLPNRPGRSRRPRPGRRHSHA